MKKYILTFQFPMLGTFYKNILKDILSMPFKVLFFQKKLKYFIAFFNILHLFIAF